MPSLDWESIDNLHERAKVFGGWLVKAYVCIEHANYVIPYDSWQREQSQELQVTMTFVPDANYEWGIER